jgi:hypothetical protein
MSLSRSIEREKHANECLLDPRLAQRFAADVDPARQCHRVRVLAEMQVRIR